MPPKGWRKTAAGFQPTNSSGVNIKDRKVHGIEELLLPRTVIAKLAKQSLPENTPLPKDGVTALMRSVAMFTSYITAEANQIARQESRKTVTHADILRALEACHFGSFVNATSELSEQMVVKSKASSENIDEQGGAPAGEESEKAAAAADIDEVGEEDDDDNYIEEDVEPKIDISINTVSGFSEQKKQRTSTTEPNSDAEMQVDS